MEGEKGKGKKEKGESSSTRRFRPAHYELEAWKSAMRLVGAIYRLTAAFPPSEQFGLTSQMRRAAVSAPSNLAEGAARAGNAEMARFCTVARASLMELDTQLLLSQDLGMCADTTELRKQTHECVALINGLIRHRQAKINKPA